MLRNIVSYAEQLLGRKPRFRRQPWEAFAHLPPENYTRAITPEELVNLADHRRDERVNACNGNEPLVAMAAYAQDWLAYDAEGRIAPSDVYETLPPQSRVNKFGQAYKTGSPVWLHRHLADVMVDMAVDLHNSHRWTTVVFDGLRTMEGGYILYCNARDEWLRDKLLSAPGRSAHNRALAVDSMLFDSQGREIDMGGHFDHANMQTNRRDYSGTGITPQAKQNRLIREQAFLRAGLKRGTVVMPLREEFWHDQVPGTEADLWRVIESACRCIGQEPPAERATNYAAFAAQWKLLDAAKMRAAFGEITVPPPQNIVYHECLKPIYDCELPPEMRQALPMPAGV